LWNRIVLCICAFLNGFRPSSTSRGIRSASSEWSSQTGEPYLGSFCCRSYSTAVRRILHIGISWLIDLGAFIIGLILIPAGIYLRGRRLRKQGETEERAFPPFTLHSPELRKPLIFILLTTFANVVIAGQLTYSAAVHEVLSERGLGVAHCNPGVSSSIRS
jgi:hypothetical protein